MKRPFLTVYDYGTGGVWFYVWASNPADIEARFDAQVIHDLPPWLHGQSVRTVDIDGPPEPGLPLRSEG
jgi:hypothetical protein